MGYCGYWIWGLCFCSFGVGVAVDAGELKEGKLHSALVPGPVSYGVVLPESYDAGGAPYPFLLLLHGGASDHQELNEWKELLEELWKRGELPPLVAAMPSSGKPTIDGRVRYMDFKDGSEKWESFVVGPFVEHIRKRYNVVQDQDGMIVAGISDGGFAALRFGFKYPDQFSGVAALEPAIMPALQWKDVSPRNGFFISTELIARFYGDPVDQAYWAKNNPASIAKENAKRIRESGLKIYLECGDEDYLNLAEGTEFLHQILWNCDIRHEYHLVRGANHLGRTLKPRMIESLKFIERVLNPPEPEPDPLKEAKEVFDKLKAEGEKESPKRFWSEPHLN